MSPARSESPCNTCINLFRNASSRDPILSSRSGYVCSRIRLELEDAADLGCPLCEYVVRQDLRYPWIWPKNFHHILRNHDGPRPSSWPPGDEEISYSVRLEPERRNCIQIGAVKGMNFGNMVVVFLVFARQGEHGYVFYPQLFSSLVTNPIFYKQMTRLLDTSLNVQLIKKLGPRRAFPWPDDGFTNA